MSGTVGTQAVVMPIPDKLDMRRYAPDSTKFGDAKPSVFEELKVGDQVRALGNKSADGTRFTPERLVSGSFRMVAGTVTAVDAATGEVQIKDLQTRQSLTVVIKPDSVIRKFPDMAAMAAAQAAARAGAQGAGASGAAAPKAGAPATPAAGQSPKPGAGGAPSGPAAAPAAPSIQDMLDRLPVITAAQLKAGDIIIVSSTKGADLILVMHEGEIVERGTHTELVERRNYYANLVQATIGGG